MIATRKRNKKNHWGGKEGRRYKQKMRDFFSLESLVPHREPRESAVMWVEEKVSQK
jgi:hypothetical protein